MTAESNQSKYYLRSGNFELTNFELRRKHVCNDWEALKSLAIEKATCDSVETIASFETKQDALNELKNHKSDITWTQFYVGSGYDGTIYWVDEESNDGECVDTWEYAEFEKNPFEEEYEEEWDCE